MYTYTFMCDNITHIHSFELVLTQLNSAGNLGVSCYLFVWVCGMVLCIHVVSCTYILHAVVRLAVGGLSLETVLSSIHLYRCHDYLELLATIHILPDIIKQHPKVPMSLCHL